MPAKSFVMAFVLSGWLVALVMAGLIVGYTGFFGIAVLGLIILCFSVIVDQDHDGVVGAGVTPAFLAQQVQAQTEMSNAQRRLSREARSTHVCKYLGLAMILVGLGGFWLFQL